MWTTLLTELNRAGLSDTEIGRRVGIAQSTISRLRKGVTKETSWETGQALIALRGQVAPEPTPCHPS